MVKFVIGSAKFMRILEDQWNKGTFIFNVQQNRVVCKPEDFNFQANGIGGFDDLNLLPCIDRQ